MTPLTRAQCARCQQKAAATASASAPRKNRVAGVVQFLTSPCWSPLSFPRPQTSRGGSSTDSGINIQLFELECLSTMLMCSGENRSPRRTPEEPPVAQTRPQSEPGSSPVAGVTRACPANTGARPAGHRGLQSAASTSTARWIFTVQSENQTWFGTRLLCVCFSWSRKLMPTCQITHVSCSSREE